MAPDGAVLLFLLMTCWRLIMLCEKMTDLLADIRMKPRYGVRTQAAFVRNLKLLTPQDADHIPRFNIQPLSRIHDMNPLIFVCALSLLNEGIDEPGPIRQSEIFQRLVDRLVTQRSSKKRETLSTQDVQKASLLLLEVFLYMTMIHKARIVEAETHPSRDEEDLTM